MVALNSRTARQPPRGTPMRALAFSTALIVLTAGSGMAAGTKTFFKPQHGNLPVDFCLYWSKACGQPSADRFCRVRGFEGAVKFVKVPSGATRVQGTGQVCSGGDCASFISIT
jgi:hypothetical protein